MKKEQVNRDKVRLRLSSAVSMGITIKHIAAASGVNYQKVYCFCRGIYGRAVTDSELALINMELDKIKRAL